MTGANPCSAPGCIKKTASVAGLCWTHRPAPPVTRDGDRVWIGTMMVLNVDAARTLALALADALEAP